MLPRLTDIIGLDMAPNPEISGLTADSRKVGPGFLFAALPGTKADGRGFIADAISKGAAAILAPIETKIDTDAVPLVTVANPRRAFALAAAAFHGVQPAVMTAVTGTNGKTSVANFSRQMWALLGLKSAALGTLGIIAEGWPHQGSLTTPDPADLHAALADLARFGVTHACMEASSHGLDQFRLDGVKLKAAAFTNLTRDHLDYHGDMDSYGAAKLRLFTELLPADGVAVVNADSHITIPGAKVLSYGRKGKDLKLVDARPEPHGQVLDLEILGRKVTVRLPLAGTFQASNALAALGLVIACGADSIAATATLEHLDGVPGRLQKVAETITGAPVYVDYAHTPDALETVLGALRPHAARLIVVFGCGGDRDPGKRPQMGAIAARLADIAIVTDDNPRSEDPALIRRAILTAAPKALEIGDRAGAIRHAVGLAQAGDVVVLAGKGHEAGQIVGAVTLTFDDADEARKAVAHLNGGVAA
ncbi:MAG: UDP-N-acetylmuramoyl-L-alanyl-D-glutamate--2,6-diaminopimelate ligase [Rhodospirillaceae bacterium]|nr:UDP-N-acetylmuramoyl-L-alanyl-D-glutamate--2,6-diaminopimelate ligase [Rhodospirillales bacterium]